MPTTNANARNTVAAPDDAAPTIAERVARGRENQSAQGGAIVPTPERGSLRAAPIPAALSGKQAGDIKHLIMAGYVEKGRHIYTAPGGEQIMAVCRLEHPSEPKVFRPLRFLGKAGDGRYLYDLTAVETARPLYNLAEIAANPKAKIILVEGEKAADAALARFPDHVCTTWPNGSNAVGKADFRDLRGRDLVLWPDNDKAGKDAMDKAAARLLALGCTVAIVQVPESYPEKYDLADADPEGLSPAELPAALLAAAKPIDAATAATMLAAAVAKAKVAQPARAGGTEEMHRFFSVVRWLGTTGKRDYACGGGYGDWFDVMCAAKNGYGDAAFAAFTALSTEYGGTDTDEKLRRKWDSLEPRSEGERKMPATFFAEALEAGWTDPSAGGGGTGSGRAERSDPASVVLEQSAEAGDVLWLDQYGKGFASMLVEGSDGIERTIHVRIGGKRHKGAVSRRYRQAHKNKVLSAEAERRAIQNMVHNAEESGLVHQSAVRVAAHEGCVYVDLGRADGKVVRVADDGWQVQDTAPVRFVRGSRGELPLPESGGTLAEFERHFNLAPPDVLRVVAFILGTLAPIGSFPILLIEGGAGSAKSTNADFALGLCDPPHTPKGGRITMPRAEAHLLIHASGVRVVFLDNVSDISNPESDMMCRLSTGGGTSARTLHSDDDESQISAVRPAIVTAIGTPTARGDFLDRCIRVTALPIKRRRTEEAVYAAFAADQPRMFGFILDALACSLRKKTQVQASADAGTLNLFRMADFGLYVEAAAEKLGLEPGAFSAEVMNEQAGMQAEGALGDPLGEALARYFSAARHERKELAGHATEVLDELRSISADPSALPASNKLKGVLRRLENGLATIGIAVQVTEPSLGKRNRKTFYKLSTTNAFQPIGEELPF